MDFNIYAQIRLILSIIFLAFQLITLPQFMMHKEYRQGTCFRLMFAIGLCESYQMLVMGLGPFFKYVDLWTAGIENISGALNESTLDVMFLLNLVLAVNRLCVVVKMNVLKQFGEGQLGWERALYRTLFTLSALLFVLLTVLFASPLCGLYLDPEFFVWNYNFSLSLANGTQRVETYGYMALPTLSFALYCSIVLVMRLNASKMLTDNASVAMQRARENRILLQSFVQFLIFIVPCVYGFVDWSPGKTALDNYGITSVATVCSCGLNPFLYLILLPQFRQQVLLSLRIARPTNTKTPTVVMQSKTKTPLFVRPQQQ